MKTKFSYRDVSFIINKKELLVKNDFKDILKTDKVDINMLVDLDVLNSFYGNIRSVDARYDGLPKFSFMLDQVSKSFRNYLNDRSSIKKGEFTGKLSLFYDIISEEDVRFCNEVLSYKKNYLYGKKTKRVSGQDSQ